VLPRSPHKPPASRLRLAIANPTHTWTGIVGFPKQAPTLTPPELSRRRGLIRTHGNQEIAERPSIVILT
jgi:hypothetical protein